jgi:hypothetical protein
MNTVFPSELVTCQAVWTDRQTHEFIKLCVHVRDRDGIILCIIRWVYPPQQRHLIVFKLFCYPRRSISSHVGPHFQSFLSRNHALKITYSANVDLFLNEVNPVQATNNVWGLYQPLFWHKWK